MKQKIAIITNDVLFWNLLKPLLIDKIPDIKIYICSNYNEINLIFERFKFDLVLVDGGIEGISSIEMIQYLRSSKRVIAPVWFFPEIITELYIHRSRLMGASRIINKPFDPFKITDEISSLFVNQPIQN